LRNGALDFAAMGVVWLATAPVAYALNVAASQSQSLYFWSLVHGRALAMLRPGIFLMFSLLIVTNLPRLTGLIPRRASLIPLALCSVIWGAMGWSLAHTEINPITRLESQLEVLEQRLGHSVKFNRQEEHWETVAYYRLSKTSDTMEIHR